MAGALGWSVFLLSHPGKAQGPVPRPGLEQGSWHSRAERAGSGPAGQVREALFHACISAWFSYFCPVNLCEQDLKTQKQMSVCFQVPSVLASCGPFRPSDGWPLSHRFGPWEHTGSSPGLTWAGRASQTQVVSGVWPAAGWPLTSALKRGTVEGFRSKVESLTKTSSKCVFQLIP